jgi:hypothetical protein
MGKAIEKKKKKTDAVSVERKISAWARITTQYDSQPESTTVHTAQQLKKLWANIQNTLLTYIWNFFSYFVKKVIKIFRLAIDTYLMLT